MSNKISVDKDSYEFLKTIYFGVYNDPFEAASNRAYRDFCRTLLLSDIETDKRYDLRRKVTDILRSRITEIDRITSVTKHEFDEWHKETCLLIQQAYTEMNIDLTIGQAQKWLNMTIKYFFVLGDCDFKATFSYLHIPIDNYIIQIAKREFDIPVPKDKWSTWTDYDLQYMNYQNRLLSKIKGVEPLRWELIHWLKEARNRQIYAKS